MAWSSVAAALAGRSVQQRFGYRCLSVLFLPVTGGVGEACQAGVTVLRVLQHCSDPASCSLHAFTVQSLAQSPSVVADGGTDLGGVVRMLRQ